MASMAVDAGANIHMQEYIDPDQVCPRANSGVARLLAKCLAQI
eukprot:gene185-163_t